MYDIVSIIIPTYNGERYIKETIDSCLEQTYTAIEIIVIDDCSTDNTIEILKTYKDKIKLHLNKENKGICKNVNKGVTLSLGKFFILLGHDDILPANHIMTMLMEFSFDTVAVHCNSIVIDELGKEKRIAKNDLTNLNKTENVMFHLSLNNFIQSCGMMHRKDIFDKIGGWDEKYKNFGEWLYYIKMCQYGRLQYTVQTKAFYRKHDTNITNTFKNCVVYIELEKYKNECRKLAHSLNKNTFYENIMYYWKQLKISLKHQMNIRSKKCY